MIDEERIEDILRKTGAILENGHFQLKSGMHTDSYINVFLALTYPECRSLLGNAIAERFRDDHINAVVGGVTFGGHILADEVAEALGARPVSVEKRGPTISFSAGHSIDQDENVLIVDEGVTTGNSVKRVLEFVRDTKKGRVKGVGVVVDRSEERPDFGVKTEYLIRKKMSLWSQETCSLCLLGKPLIIVDSPEENPYQIRFSLTPEIFRLLYPFICKILKQWGRNELLEEIRSYESPLYELPGEKYKRVAVLGSLDTYGQIERIAREVASLEFYGITSKLIYQSSSPKRRDWTHYEHESMNDFVRRMIYSCQCVIIDFTIQGGQLIETTWCSQSNKPTLGLFEIRP